MDPLNFLGLLIILLASKATCCPLPEENAPLCTCQDFAEDSVMSCSKVLWTEDLIGPMKAVSKHKTKLFSFSLHNSSLLFIPNGIFKDIHIEQIRLISTELQALSDTDIAFRGLEETLTELRSMHAEYVSQWSWQHLRNLRRLSLIDVHSMILEAIDEPFPHLPVLTALGIIRAKISYIVDSAFSKLNKLTIFNLMENEISEVKRNMLPDPANHLSIIDLSNNKISELPEDFFSNMPRITEVHLDRNHFTFLNEKPFALAFSVLTQLTMTENPIRCDCRMRWVTETRYPFTLGVQCSSPEILKGKSLRDLEVKQLWC